MEIVEGLGSILSSNLLENNRTPGMSIYEIGNIIYFVVNDKPQIFFRRVLRVVSNRVREQFENLIPSRPPLALRAP